MKDIPVSLPVLTSRLRALVYLQRVKPQTLVFGSMKDGRPQPVREFDDKGLARENIYLKLGDYKKKLGLYELMQVFC